MKNKGLLQIILIIAASIDWKRLLTLMNDEYIEQQSAKSSTDDM
jgi:hypothetical protein